MVANGFIHHFQSLWTTVHLNNVNDAAITISGYLFRHPSFSKNYGAEVNLAIKKTLMSPSIHWTYKLGHYFNGTDTKALENTAMWLDFSIAFDDL